MAPLPKKPALPAAIRTDSLNHEMGEGIAVLVAPADVIENPYHSHEGDKTDDAAGVRGVDEPQKRAVALLSLKCSRGETALSLKRQELSNGMSIKLAWTLPEKPVGCIQACL